MLAMAHFYGSIRSSDLKVKSIQFVWIGNEMNVKFGPWSEIHLARRNLGQLRPRIERRNGGERTCGGVTRFFRRHDLHQNNTDKMTVTRWLFVCLATWWPEFMTCPNPMQLTDAAIGYLIWHCWRHVSLPMLTNPKCALSVFWRSFLFWTFHLLHFLTEEYFPQLGFKPGWLN